MGCSRGERENGEIGAVGQGVDHGVMGVVGVVQRGCRGRWRCVQGGGCAAADAGVCALMRAKGGGGVLTGSDGDDCENSKCSNKQGGRCQRLYTASAYVYSRCVAAPFSVCFRASS